MGNGQSVGSGIGDLFYPDNPRRRDRASQLESDCRTAIDEFNRLKGQYDKDCLRVRSVMMTYLKKHGFNSVEQLDNHVQSILNGEDLANWQNLKNVLGTQNIITDIVMTASGVAVVGGAGVIGLLVLAGVMSGPVGWAALGTVATIAAFVAGIVLVYGIIEGSIERDHLRETINALHSRRQEIYVQLRTLQAYKSWIAAFEMFFLDEDLQKHPEVFEKRYQKSFEEDAARGEPLAVSQELHEMDVRRGSWMNEDPARWKSEAGARVVAMKTMKTMHTGTSEGVKPQSAFIFVDQTGAEHSMNARVVEQAARHECTIEEVAKGIHWKMTAELSAEQKESKLISLDEVLFTLVNLADVSQTLVHCKMIPQVSHTVP